MGYIYLRTNKVNEKQYVGQAKDLEKRQNDWKRKGRYAGKAINAAREKYGIDAFDFKILKECEDEDLNYWETYYIKELNTKVPYGYNMTDGGEGCRGIEPWNKGKTNIYSEETKRKISETQKGKHLSEETRKKIGEREKGEKHWNYGKHRPEETKKKIGEAQKGKQVSEETKRKISEASRGRTFSEETRKKLSEYKGEKRWNYGKHLSEEHKNKICEANKGKEPWCKGKHLSEETRKKMSETHLKKEIFQIDMNTGQIIMEFQSLMEVQRQLGYDSGSVSRCCNGKRQTAYGFKWEYKKVS